MVIAIYQSHNNHSRLKKIMPLFMDGVQLRLGYRATTKRQFTYTNKSPQVPGTHLGSNPNYMFGQALRSILITRLSRTFGSYKIKCSDLHRVSKTVSLPMQWTKVGLRKAKFFHKKFLYIILYHFIKCQDQNFTSPDIKESAFLRSSLGT